MAYLYPYGDTQQLNLDWLIEQWNEVKSQIDGSLQAEIDKVEAAITELLEARDDAIAAQAATQASAQAAAGSASTASGAAMTATAQAQAAAGSAATAGAHASDAQGYAATAQQAAQAANNSAGAAAVSEGNARNSETAAAGSSSAAAGNALYSEGYAKGTQNGTPVSSGSPYYENNAKYYSDQAAQDASDAADAAQDAHDVLDSIPADYTALSDDVSDLNSLMVMTEGFPLLMPNKTTLTRYGVTVEKFGNILKLDADDRTSTFFIGVNGEYCGQNTPSLTELANGTYKIVIRFKGLLTSNTITGSGIALYCDDVDENNVITNILSPRPQINMQATDQTILAAYQFVKNNQHNFSFRIQLRAHIVHGLLRVDIIPN